MIRNLKILIAAAMALAAFGAISASGAQGAEFHCSVEPCTITVNPDGAVPSKTAHQVFVFKQGATSLSTTCNQVTGHATSATKTFKTLTLTGIVFDHCTVAGQPFIIRMNGCHFHFETPGATHNASAQIQCPVGKVIEKEIPATGCLVTIGSTGVLGGGLKLHDPKTGGIEKTEITAETTITNIPINFNNKCPAPIVEGAGTGEITTWNFELTAEEDKEPFKHASLWWT